MRGLSKHQRRVIPCQLNQTSQAKNLDLFIFFLLKAEILNLMNVY